MRILFDHQIFSLQDYGGITRYFTNLHSSINAGITNSSRIGLLATNNHYLDNPGILHGLLNLNGNKSKIYKYNKWYCKYLLVQNRFDVFHPTFYNPYFLQYLKKPFVLTVHDMINERFPQFYRSDPSAGNKKTLIKRADRIITISDFTKKDLLEFYPESKNKITVVHHGFKIKITTHSPGPGKFCSLIPNEQYLLYVGDRYGYKNFLFFVNAVAPLLKRYNIKLICAGGKVFNDDELKTFNKLGLAGKISRLDVNDRQLSQLYQKALAFVYPSLYEGFGLPILEAFNNSCPVILSNTTAFPEVAGNAAEYFDPYNRDSIYTAVGTVLHDKEKQDELRSKGKQRLEMFNMNTCLRKTLQVYASL